MEMIMRSYPNDWVGNSIMCTQGIAKGRLGAEHDLTEEKQGSYHYTIGPYSEPVLEIKPGDRVIVETRDAFEGMIQSESDKPSDLLRLPLSIRNVAPS